MNSARPSGREGPLRPLQGIRVIDFSRIIAGPLCTQALADLGAEVIKIERAEGGDESRGYVFPALWGSISAMYLAFNRGKRSVALDLGDAGARAVALEWVAAADVVVENFRPGVMERLGLDYAAVAARNPGVVYCSISGFGESGPLAEAGANDLVAQASTGLMSLNAGSDGRPVKVAPAMVDLNTGANAALAVVAALYARSQSGRGTHITTSLFESGVAMLSYFATSQFAAGEGRMDLSVGGSITVPNQSFRTADGWLVVACSNEPMWQRFCAAIERSDLAADPRFHTNGDRTTHQAALVAELDAWFVRRPRAEWLGRFERAKVSAAAVLEVDEVLRHPQARHLDLVQAVAHPQLADFRVVRTPFRYDGESLVARRAPPALDADRQELIPPAAPPQD